MGDFAEVLSAEAPADPARLLALRLHALHADDRRWLLGQVPPEARMTLETLLRELQEMGVPAGKSGLPVDVLAGKRGQEHAVCVDAATAEQVWEVLREEPEAIRTIIVFARHWRWREKLLTQYMPNLAHARVSAPEGVTDRVKRSMIVALAARLPAAGRPA
jgi:hypothetical protein